VPSQFWLKNHNLFKDYLTSINATRKIHFTKFLFAKAEPGKLLMWMTFSLQEMGI
jgi:hypothetical protein